jgi:hypothetical protein
MKSNRLKVFILIIVLISILLSGCKKSEESTPTATQLPTRSPTKIPTKKPPAPTLTPTQDLAFDPLPLVNVAHCDWAIPITPTKFSFDGSLFLHIPNTDSTKLNLYRVDNQSETIQVVGSYLSGADYYLGPRIFLSPNGEWVLVRTEWSPDSDEIPPVLIEAVDLSETILIPWDEDWDVTLGWWDDENIVVLPADGGMDDILLLNIFTQETSIFTETQGASQIDLAKLSAKSPWRGSWGIGVAFNHEFTQLLHFSSDGLTLSDLSNGEQLWVVKQPWDYPYDPALEGLALWSPDDRFAAVPLADGDIQELFLIGADGEPWQVTDFHNTEYDQVALHLGAWSPNGKLLAFYARYGGADEQSIQQIFILDLDAREIRNMCADGSPVMFSPDGKYLAFYGQHPSSDIFTRIIIMDLETGEKWLLDETKNWHIIDWIE